MNRIVCGLLFVLVAVLGGCRAREEAGAQPDPILRNRIERLIDLLLAGMVTGELKPVIEESRAIFESSGVPGVPRVGDAAAYGFVVVNMVAQPAAFRREFFEKVTEADARGELPPDARRFAAARIRQLDLAERFRGKEPSHPALRDEILKLVKDDQAARERDRFDLEKMHATDQRIEGPLKRMLDEFGVPTYDMVGVDAAKSFIVMIQHQPAPFRAAALPKLKANVDAGQADPETYATVYDRTQQDQGRNQMYGQNFMCGANKTLEPAPLDDAANVNARRAEMGLLRLELYARVLRASSPDMCR